MPLSAWYQFLFVAGLGLAISGLTAYVITWMLVAVHLRDHHPDERRRLGGFLFSPRALGWYLRARWRSVGDRNLSALAVLGSIGAWAITSGGALAVVIRVLATAGAPR